MKKLLAVLLLCLPRLALAVGTVTSSVDFYSNAINCTTGSPDANCTGYFDDATAVTLTATADNTTSRFLAWTDAFCSLALNHSGQFGRVCTITSIGKDYAVTPTYQVLRTVTVTKVAGGTVSSNADAFNHQISCTDGSSAADCTGYFDTGSTVTLNGNAVNVLTATTWSYTLSAAEINAFGQGAETLTAIATDAAGNTTTATRGASSGAIPTNQAWSGCPGTLCAVPVLPPTRTPGTAAAFEKPSSTASPISARIAPAVCADTARPSEVGSFRRSVRGPASVRARTSATIHGRGTSPSRAIVAATTATCRGDNSNSPCPNAVEASNNAGMGRVRPTLDELVSIPSASAVPMPKRAAYSRRRASPILSPKSANTTFDDHAKPCAKSNVARGGRSASVIRKPSITVSPVGSETDVAGVTIPRSIPAAAVTSLKVLPGTYKPCAARCTSGFAGSARSADQRASIPSGSCPPQSRRAA